VVFDLDGTLVDSAPDIARALSAAFAPLEARPFTAADAQRLIGGGAAVAIDRAQQLLGLALVAEHRSAALERFFEAYAKVSAEGNGLFPGVHELLDHLEAKDIARGICTNKAQHVAEIALRALGIGHRFGAVVGARDDLPKKPNPAMLNLVVERLGVAIGETVLVGDSPADAGLARAAGCPVVLVDFGYASTPVAELGADAIISHLSELPAALARMVRGQTPDAAPIGPVSGS
jgi:phosphoglycolate phosphatase